MTGVRDTGKAPRTTPGAPLGTIPRRLVECGGAVEEPGGLWHICESGEYTHCGELCEDWPRVVRAVERKGVWCGVCLITVARLYDPASESVDE